MNYCSSCGQKVSEGMKFCPDCGQRLAVQEKEEKEEMQENPREVRSKTFVVERTEPTYYSDQNGVRITSTRLIIPGKNRNEGPSTYAMANITSVKTEKHPSKRWVGILVACFGVIFGYFGQVTGMDFAPIIGVVLLVLGILLAILLKPTYHLRISSASGETDAFPPIKDKQYLDRVANALNEALIKRG